MVTARTEDVRADTASRTGRPEPVTGPPARAAWRDPRRTGARAGPARPGARTVCASRRTGPPPGAGPTCPARAVRTRHGSFRCACVASCRDVSRVPIGDAGRRTAKAGGRLLAVTRKPSPWARLGAGAVARCPGRGVEEDRHAGDTVAGRAGKSRGAPPAASVKGSALPGDCRCHKVRRTDLAAAWPDAGVPREAPAPEASG
jgi:hypothetical protein